MSYITSFLGIGLGEHLLSRFKATFGWVAQARGVCALIMQSPGRQSLRVSMAEALALVFFVAMSANAGAASSLIHSEDVPQPMIKRIVIDRQNVFGAKDIAKSRALRLANKFHIPTRESVISRELLLRVGDRFDPELALETERNLRDLAFIYEASVTVDTLDPLGVTLHVQTVDRWSLSSGLKVLRRSERNLLRIGLTESNLLGYGQRVGVTYTVFKPDPSYVAFEYKNPRILGSFSELGVDVIGNPLDRTTRFTIQRRYLHQSDVFSYRLSYLNFLQRDIDVTSIGDTAATYFQDGNRIDLGFSTRTGDYHRKLTARMNYQYKSKKVQDLATFNGYLLDGAGDLIPPATLIPADTFTLPTDSAFHQLTFSLSGSRSDFYRERRIKYQRRTEDITIVNSLGILYGQSRERGVGGHLYSVWQIGANYGIRVSDVIVAGGLSRTGWVKNGNELRSTLSSNVIAYFNRFSWVTFAGRARLHYDKRRGDPNPLSLDGVSGVRGYPANFVTGRKLFIGNFESRLFSGISALTARMGFALHFDFGAAWGEGDKFGLDRIVWSAGPGLRIDMGQVGTIRLDVSYANSIDSWEISAATGQFFDLNPGK